MVVTVQSEIPGIAGEMVLKLFDRRFAQRCRVDENIEDWSPEYEEAYHKFLSDGRAPDFISSLPPSSFDEDRENWDDGQYEAYCHHILNRLYNAEVETYETLQDLQGNDIPRLYARVTLPIPASFEDPSLQQWVDIPGILIEYLDGFDLTDLHQHAPKETWQSIGDEAMRIINVIGDRGILNTDVNRRSFNINPKDFKARMMDFGNCRFRRDFGSEDEWRSAQAHEDEEGAIGTMMQVKLGEISPGAFTYKRSAKYEQLDQDFMMEEV
ncbi:hypothetical protein N7492_010366 [Penicillium capsulatum]|uniref:Protein kinase domain-containing protein n=1 Tax=Penicillium capsulatum TaxID=69766 RepID=A0A9W9HPK4_9EURO|nr:hypothetical protein N7492_010366 [Penicillium capsulatum]